MDFIFIMGFLLFLGVGCVGGIAFLATLSRQRQRLERLERLVRNLERPPLAAAATEGESSTGTVEDEKRAEERAPAPPAPVAAVPARGRSGREAPATRPRDVAATSRVERAAAPVEPGGIGSTERLIGTRYLAWSGAIILVLGVAYFLRHAYDVGLVGPSGRLAIGALFGTSLIAAARTSRVRELKAWAGVATGVGIAIYYACAYFAFEIYGVWGPGTTFAASSIVTLFAFGLAMKDDEVGVAALGITGGFLSPMVISVDSGEAWHLLAYVFVLDLFALGLAAFRRWRIIDAAALIGTVVLSWAWAWAAREFDVGDVTFATTGISLLWLNFIVMVIVRGLRERESLHVETLLTAVAACGAASIAWSFALEDLVVARLAVPGVAALLLLGMAEVVGRVIPDRPMGRRALRFQAMATMAAAVCVAAGLENLATVTALQAIVCAAARGTWSPTEDGRKATAVLGPVLLALHGASCLALLPWSSDAVTLWNEQYVTAVIVAAACLLSARLGSRSDDGESSAMGLVPFLGIVAISLATHIELGRVLGSDAYGVEVVSVAATWSMALVMATVAVGAMRSRPLAACTVALAFAAFIACFSLCTTYPEAREAFFVNPRVATGAMLTLSLFFMRRRLPGFPLAVSTRRTLSSVMSFLGLSAILLVVFQDIWMFADARDLADEWPLGGVLVLLSTAALVVNITSRRFDSAAGVAYGVALRLFATLHAARCLVDWSGNDVLFLDWFTAVMTLYVVTSCLERHSNEARTALAMPTQLIAFFALFVEIESWSASSTSDLWFVGEVSPALGRGLISAVWALQAFTLIAVGLRAQRRELRVLGFLVFATVAGKVLLFDLEFLDKVYRVLSFVGTGALLLGGSYLYHAVGRRVDADGRDATSPA